MKQVFQHGQAALDSQGGKRKLEKKLSLRKRMRGAMFKHLSQGEDEKEEMKQLVNASNLKKKILHSFQQKAELYTKIQKFSDQVEVIEDLDSSDYHNSSSSSDDGAMYSRQTTFKSTGDIPLLAPSLGRHSSV